MKHSIRRQITVIFICVLVFILGSLFIVNMGFLEQYYFSCKTKDILETYKDVDKALQKDTFKNDDVQNEIRYQVEKMNVDLIIIDSRGQSAFSTLSDQDPRLLQMLSDFRNIVENDSIQGDVMRRTDDYILYRNSDWQGSTEYLKMYGYFSDGSFFMMQSPLESMRESAALANRFLIYLGVTGIILGGGLVWLLSRKVTKPIMELAELSKEMANLNFDARYTRGGSDEIGILGENFNKMSARLERTVSELKRANNELKKDIEQKEKMEDMRNEFLGNVSHELKTPLALIQGYAEGLKEGVSDDPESREFYCDVIMDEAGKMNQMVKNLLTLNQLEFGSDEVDFERFDITGLVRGVLASCDILAQQAQARIDFSSAAPIYVWADEFKTEQVVRNYLTNAIHHVENEKRIEVKICRLEGKVRVSVFNSGKPIPEEDLPKLWDKFYKVDKAHTREYGGNGIGLSIVKAIMESFHQRYGVKNFENGVEFWFELDAQDMEEPEEELNMDKPEEEQDTDKPEEEPGVEEQDKEDREIEAGEMEDLPGEKEDNLS